MKISFILFALTGIALVACHQSGKENLGPTQNLTKYHTWEEVQNAARQYGLESVILEKNNSGLMYLPDSALHAFLQQEKKARDGKAEVDLFLQRTKEVHSFDDYLLLLNSLPYMKSSEVESQGGEAAFQQWVEEQRKINWHIYRTDDGALIWVRPEDDHGTEQGERLDRNQ